MNDKARRSPKVTVGLVVKDSEESVREALHSILIQKYPHEDMEIIAVDGGSKDRTLSITTSILSETDVHVKIRSDEGKGLAAARQIVVDNASGKYLVWVDADAVIPEDYVRKLVEFIERNPRLAGAKGIQEPVDQTSLTGKLENLSLLLRRTPRSVFDGQGIFRIKAVRQVGGFDTRIKAAGEDVDLIARIMEAGGLFTVSDAKFCHNLGSWRKRIWNRPLRAGYGIHYVGHKHRGLLNLWSKAFPVIFIIGLRDSAIAYKLTRRKISFLLPVYYSLKSIPWWLGFAASHLEGYGHIRAT